MDQNILNKKNRKDDQNFSPLNMVDKKKHLPSKTQVW